jgi:hypothetical protein
MKIACLISGQIRQINPNIINRGLHILNGHNQADYFVDVWSHLGVSMDHDIKRLSQLSEDKFAADVYLSLMLKDLNIKSVKIWNYDVWKNNLSGFPKTFFEDATNTIYQNALPQIFLIQQSILNLMTEDGYDLVLRIRPDSLFVMPVIEKANEGEVFHINFGPTANYPNRIYDIFFGSNLETFKLFHNIFDQIEENYKLEIPNHMDRRDPCRLLYMHSHRYGLKIKSLMYRYTDVYRNEGVENYIKTLNQLWVINQSLV